MLERLDVPWCAIGGLAVNHWAPVVTADVDPARRPSKRQKDLLDILRLVEAHPALEPLLPEEVGQRIRSLR